MSSDKKIEMREYPAFIVPHADYGDPECPGLVFAVVRGKKRGCIHKFFP